MLIMKELIRNMFSFIVLVLFQTETALSFNFDTNYPIVYVDPYNFSAVQHAKNSYFGYSVLLYEGSNPSRSWIQIGAPRGSNPFHGYENTGIVFRCGIKSTCYNVNMKPSDSNGDTYAAESYFGNSMDISEDKSIFAACGHRWVQISGSDYWMQGACFAGKTNENTTEFFNSLYRLQPQTVLVTSVRVYNLALAQMGFSAQFVKDDQKNDLMIGLPGLLNWKGGVGLLKKGERPPAARRRRRRSIDDLRETFVPDVANTNDIKYFDLAGYSVTSGRFYSDKALYYVTGAPRASLKGSVLIFTYRNSYIEKKEIKEGKYVGEYFGASVTASDINGDGWDDLIVGAPYRKGDSPESKFDRGAIYYYLGSKVSLEADLANTISGKTDGGRFGEAVMSLGDIDKDGYADIAVAAPYDNENSGVVYIFRGSSQSGLIKEPSQVIKGKDFIPNVRGFGISLSKPADVDGNRYSDLAIGAYYSGHAVLLRAKPVIVLEHNLTSSVIHISAANLASSFNISSCVSYHGVDIQGIRDVDVVRTLSVDKGVSDRAYLEDTRNLDSKLTAPNTIHCQTYSVRIKRTATNIYDPIAIRASIDLVKQQEKKQVITVTDKVDGADEFCSNCAILRSAADTDRQINVDFNRECGDDNVCDSSLQLSTKFEGLEDHYVIGSKEHITLSTTVTNKGENAFQTEVLITLPRPVRLKRIPPNCKETSTEISCTIDNPLKKDASKTVSLELDVDEVNTGKYSNPLDFVLEVKTSSNNGGEQRKDLSLKLIKRANLELKGASTEETYSYINRTYGTANFQQIYKILKYDISPIQRASLTVHVPTSLNYGDKEVKFLSLYAPEGTLAGQPITCHSTIKTIMDDKAPVVGDSDKKKRKRRDVITAEEQLAKYPSNRTIYFNCTEESVSAGVVCGTVTCDIGPFKNSKNIAELRFKMILNISELTDYKPDKDIVIVSTTGALVIADEVSSSGNYRHGIYVPSVFIGPSAEQSIAIWIIIVAIICGILLLAIVAGVLYKLGFFKRTKKAMLLEEKAKKNAEDLSEPLTTTDGET